jgi:DNA-binding XRE family transcriptional regulator
MTDKPTFTIVKSSEIAKDPTHRLDPKYWVRKKRHNAENLILAKLLAKHLILHRIWNGLTQNDLAFDISVSHQQYQKVESVVNDPFYVQISRIFKNRGWSKEVLETDPSIVLAEWLRRDYGNLESWALPDKYHKIIDAWKLLDLKAEKNYYKK